MFSWRFCLFILIIVGAMLLTPRSPASSAQLDAAATAPLLSDEQFVSGQPRSRDALVGFFATHPDFLRDVATSAETGSETSLIDTLAQVAEAHSVSPPVLLTLAEMEYAALSTDPPALDVPEQIAAAAWLNETALQLSVDFYTYYNASAPDGDSDSSAAAQEASTNERAANAAGHALTQYFAHAAAESPNSTLFQTDEFANIYTKYFGDPLAGKLRASHPTAEELLAASAGGLPELKMPWLYNDAWYFTGGPHNLNGSGNPPLSGIDFGPPGAPNCVTPTDRWVVASAAGRTVDFQPHWVKLDHDRDGNVNTGWLTVYGHVDNRIGDGRDVAQGERLGNPSCRGGFASGVHVHFGVKFENVWQPIENLVISGRTVRNGSLNYHGFLSKPGRETAESCVRPTEFRCDFRARLISDNLQRSLPPAAPEPGPEPTPTLEPIPEPEPTPVAEGDGPSGTIPAAPTPIKEEGVERVYLPSVRR